MTNSATERDYILNGYYEKGRDTSPIDCWVAKNNHCELHFHSSLELVYVTTGTLLVNSNGNSYEISNGEAIFTPPYTLHTYSSLEEGYSINVTIPLELIPFFNTYTKNKQFIHPHFVDKDQSLLSNLQLLLLEIKKEKSSHLILKGYAYTILGILLEQLETQDYANRQLPTFNQDVLNYLQENFMLGELNSTIAAKKFGYSESRFSHLFTKSIGYSFNYYLGMLRVQHAATLLINSELSLVDIALTSGFETMRTFYRTFKRVYGITPSQYITQHITSK